jgi:hypothetical protein
MRRGLMLLSVLVALTLFAPLAVLAQDEASDATRTDVRYLVPFGPDGVNAALTVTENESGACTTDSLATPNRPDAWDCIGESNQIYDPCFENPFAAPDGPAELACFTDPFSNEVVLLTTDGPLAREKEAPAQGLHHPWDLPWAVELANGDRCALLHSIDIVLAGEAVYYGCENGGMILGLLDRGTPIWTANYLAEGAVASGLVDVAVAWS